jgi:hypothetical protein
MSPPKGKIVVESLNGGFFNNITVDMILLVMVATTIPPAVLDFDELKDQKSHKTIANFAMKCESPRGKRKISDEKGNFDV